MPVAFAVDREEELLLDLRHRMNPERILETAAQTAWVVTWASAQQRVEANNLPPAPGLARSTLRQLVSVSVGGKRLRLGLSNQYGSAPVELHAVHLAAPRGMGEIDPTRSVPLSFGGRSSVTLAAGERVHSDPVDYELPSLSRVAISIAFGEVPEALTGHPGSRTTSFLQAGDHVAAAELPLATRVEHWYLISNLDVESAPEHAAVVTFGDSITDGRGSTTDGNDRWPDQLARRLQAQPGARHVAVVNQGVGGNAVLAGGLGPTALERFERDVLEPSGVSAAIVLHGVNDIGATQDENVADALIGAYDRFIERARAESLAIFGVPILPFGGSHYDSAARERARQRVNTWIRTSGRFDAVFDLDAAVRDPSAPNRLRVECDSGDGLHLSPLGYRMMADAIDLSALTRWARRRQRTAP